MCFFLLFVSWWFYAAALTEATVYLLVQHKHSLRECLCCPLHHRWGTAKNDPTVTSSAETIHFINSNNSTVTLSPATMQQWLHHQQQCNSDIINSNNSTVTSTATIQQWHQQQFNSDIINSKNLTVTSSTATIQKWFPYSINSTATWDMYQQPFNSNNLNASI